MIVTIEISLYPLQPDYREVILGFIRSVRQVQDIETHTTEMSTLVKGEWSTVMEMLTSKLGAVFAELPACSTVIKVVPQDLDIAAGYRTVFDRSDH